MIIRPYNNNDYEQLILLYRQSELYGGQFDENRDSFERLKKKIEADVDTILVAEVDGRVVGTVSLIEDGRVAWLFRFAAIQGDNEAETLIELCDAATKRLKEKGHTQVLAYTPLGNENLNRRYENLGFSRGGDYTCYWRDI